MSNKTEELVEQLSGLTVLEMAELKKALEEKWGVEAAAAAVVAAPAAAGAGDAAAAEDEASDFEVILSEIDGSKKIAVIKAVREITGLGLREAKELVESPPKQLKESVAKEEAEEIKKKIEEAGGKATLKAV